MTEIFHQIKINDTPANVHNALSTIDGLSKWWTSTTSGDSELGGEIAFRFGEHVSKMRVEALSSDTVRWVCVESAPDWVGTSIEFRLKGDDSTTLFLRHHGWRESNDFFAHCSMKWAAFLISLKDYIETGAGAPFPDDLAV